MGARSQRGARKKQVRGSPVHAAEASQTATGFVHGVASIAPWKGVADVDARRRKGCACIRLHPQRVTDRFYHTYCQARDGDAGSGERRQPASSSPLSQRRALRSRGEGPGEIRIARSSRRLADGPGSQGRRRSREAEERRRKPRATS